MKKILIINTLEFNLGGISAVIMNYYNNLSLEKFQIDVAVNNKIEPRFEKEFRGKGANIYILKRNKNPVLYMLLLYKIMKKNSYDIIHVHGNSATMFVDLFPAYLAGCKERIAHSHNSNCEHRVLHKLLLPFFRHTYTKALACSVAAGEWIFGESPFEVLPNSIDVERFCYSETTRIRLRKELHLEDKYVVGHIGFFGAQKNQEKLFSIFAELKRKNKNAYLLCVTGNDIVPERYLELMNKLGIENDVIILRQRTDINALLQAMDVFVFPSKWEGFGMAFLEAQASGLYCVVSENVPQEAYISPRIKRIELKNPDKKWADEILCLNEKDGEREVVIRQMLTGKYNIKNSVYQLEKIYQGA